MSFQVLDERLPRHLRDPAWSRVSAYSVVMVEMTLRIPDAYAALITEGLLTVADLERAVEAAASAPLYSSMTPTQIEMILDGSGLHDAGRHTARAAIENPGRLAIERAGDAAAAMMMEMAGAVTAKSAAQIVGRDVSTITRWNRTGMLHGFIDSNGSWRIPRWQLTKDGPLPGMGTIKDHSTGLSPAALAAVMTEPSDELRGSTPRDWLIAGGDTHTVAALLDGMSTW